jgi:ParB family protein of integrating conjugative element (PFGI_1 class)
MSKRKVDFSAGVEKTMFGTSGAKLDTSDLNRPRETIADLQPDQEHSTLSVTLDDFEPYDRNPRILDNEKYDDIKASIRSQGLLNRWVLTRKPGEKQYVALYGGGTRYRICRELWEETGDDKFYRFPNLRYIPWKSDLATLGYHAAENDARADLQFVEQALLFRTMREEAEKATGKSLSQRNLCELILAESGWAVVRQRITDYEYTTEVLYPALSKLFEAGAGRPRVAELRALESKYVDLLAKLTERDPKLLALEVRPLFMETLKTIDDANVSKDAIITALDPVMAAHAGVDIPTLYLGPVSLDQVGTTGASGTENFAENISENVPGNHSETGGPVLSPTDQSDAGNLTPASLADAEHVVAASLDDVGETELSDSGTSGATALRNGASDDDTTTLLPRAPKKESLGATTPMPSPQLQPHQVHAKLKQLRRQAANLALGLVSEFNMIGSYDQSGEDNDFFLGFIISAPPAFDVRQQPAHAALYLMLHHAFYSSYRVELEAGMLANVATDELEVKAGLAAITSTAPFDDGEAVLYARHYSTMLDLHFCANPDQLSVKEKQIVNASQEFASFLAEHYNLIQMLNEAVDRSDEKG